jgi:hypothetical protein
MISYDEIIGFYYILAMVFIISLLLGEKVIIFCTLVLSCLLTLLLIM